ncbi:MAG TPA: PhnD/SsuA/transferrin family substrate-binding protein [Acidiferrobacterales bacterium]|nr:PhnD/SsuA/transferrin family substrate-binding protein [Acidiferrobacterales bacterium]
MRRITIRSWLFVCITFLGTYPAQAELILSSAPRDSREKEEEIFKPIVEMMSKAAGEKVTFRHGDNFLVYQSEMRKGSYDIMLDGPAFVGWRMAKLGHVPLVKFPGNLVFAAITKSNQDKIHGLKDLAGRTVCAFPSPNLATLTVMYEFDNPSRQPMIVEVRNFADAYKGVVSGRCIGGILQAKLHQDLDKEVKATKVLFTSKPLPNQAFSAGPRLTPEKRERVIQAFLSAEGAVATQKLRDVYKVQTLLPATVEEFQGLGKLMRDVWGFEL